MFYATNMALSMGQMTGSVWKKLQMKREEQFPFTESTDKSWEEVGLTNKEVIRNTGVSVQLQF